MNEGVVTPAQAPVPPLLEVRGVTLQYKTRDHLVTAAYRVDFDVYRSDRFVILGPSGCGKSTLLKAVGGYMKPVEGSMLLNGAEIGRPGADRVMVFQEFDQLLPWKTVKQNVAFALTSSGKLGAREAEARALHYIDKVNLTRFADSYPHTLSGGMKQRVAIARVLANDCEVLLMDEPFGALDALTRAKLQDELLDIVAKSNSTVVMVTHDVDEAVLLSDRIVMMTNGPAATIGEIVSVDLPKPRSRLELADDARYQFHRKQVIDFLYKRQSHVEKAA